MDNKGNLLIVDDDPVIVFYLKMLFREKSYAVRTAFSALDALRLLDDFPFDILLTDIQMPGMNGLKLIEQAKKVRPDLQCLVLSANQDVEYAVEAISLGASFLRKPVDFRRLEAVVRQKIENGFMEKRRAREGEGRCRQQGSGPGRRLLEGIIAICASCKSIRDERGDWREIETYIDDPSDGKFSHGICPGCAMRLYPEHRYAE